MSEGERTGRVLVTGGAGFIGLHLVRRLLDDGWSVVVADDLSRGRADADLAAVADHPRVEVHQVDLLDPASIPTLGTDLTHVVHTAARLGVATVLEQPATVLRDNVALLQVGLDLAARQPRLERFVFLSTSEVYAGTQLVHGLTYPTPETTPLTTTPLDHPRTSYMLSKVYGEAMCHHSGLPTTIVRPHNVYGPRMGMDHVVPQVSARIHAAPPGADLVVHSPDHQRTFCYVDDAVAHLASLMVHPDAAGRTLNLGVDRPEVTMADLADRLLGVAGRRDLVVVGGETTAGSPPRRCPDVSALTALTRHTGTVPLDEGLARTWSWYREHVFTG